MSISKLALVAGVIAAVAFLGGAVVLAKSSFDRPQAPAGGAATFGQNGYGRAGANGNGSGYYDPPGPGASGSYGPGMMGDYGPYGSGSASWDQMWGAMRSGNFSDMYQICRAHFNNG